MPYFKQFWSQVKVWFSKKSRFWAVRLSNLKAGKTSQKSCFVIKQICRPLNSFGESVPERFVCYLVRSLDSQAFEKMSGYSDMSFGFPRIASRLTRQSLPVKGLSPFWKKQKQILYYNNDLKTCHPNTGKIRKQDFLVSRFQIVAMIRLLDQLKIIPILRGGTLRLIPPCYHVQLYKSLRMMPPKAWC